MPGATTSTFEPALKNVYLGRGSKRQMPAVSQAQRRFMGAEYRRKKEGKSTKTKMSLGQLRDFASTREKGLPEKKSPASGFRSLRGRMSKKKR